MKDYIKRKITGTSLEPLARKVWNRYLALNKGKADNNRAAYGPVQDHETRDLTRAYDYDRLIEEEKEHYSKIEVTEKLTEGGRHAHEAWEFYWKRVSENIQASSGAYGNLVAYLEKNIPEDKKINVLSLGSGYCGHEIMMAEQFSREYEILCVDINEDLFKKAREVADGKDLGLSFAVRDLNFIEIPPGKYDLIFAHAVLHHIINLEHLYGQIAGGLTDEGLFHLIEVVGKNRLLIWEENQAVVNKLLDICPAGLVADTRIHVTEEEEGMEGVRQEEILPLLKDYFYPKYEHLHGAFMRYVCLDERLGKALCPSRTEARKYLDFLIDCDESCVRRKLLRPLEVWGVYRPKMSKDFKQAQDKPDKLSIGDTDQNKRISLDHFFENLPLSNDPEFNPSNQQPLEHQKLPLERLFLFEDVRGKTVLEIGADDAALLYRLKDKGMRRGVGINNWYWDDQKVKAIKVADDVVLSYGDIRSLPFEDQCFDLIFTVAAFEHIHDLETAVDEMYRLLKPGGIVYSFYGPLWSSGVGHHLYFERNGVWYKFSDKNSVLPILDDYEHLIFNREEMKARLKAGWDDEAVEEFIYQIYDNPHINRYMFSDYMRIFEDSDFKVLHLENLGRMEIKPEVYERLCSMYGKNNDFSCATLEVVLKKD